MSSRAHEISEIYNSNLPADVRAEIADVQVAIEDRFGKPQRKVLLIGGSGYIGTVVTTDLLNKGYAVRNLDGHLYKNDVAALSFVSHSDYEFMHGDLCDPRTMDRALQGVTDVVFLAGLVGDPITKKYPDESTVINDKGVKAAIDGLNGRGLANVLFISTCSNYGLIKTNELADEKFELNPLSSYARDKVAAELHILSKKGETDYSPTVLRFATAFGISPRMRYDLTVNEFTRMLWLDEELLVFDADTWRPYCHVRDFSVLIRRVMEMSDERSSFEIFNAGGEENNATKQMILDRIKKRLPEAKITYQEKGSDPRNYRVDFSKVADKMLFTPSFNLDDGIDEIISAHERGMFRRANSALPPLGNYEIFYDDIG